MIYFRKQLLEKYVYIQIFHLEMTNVGYIKTENLIKLSISEISAIILKIMETFLGIKIFILYITL
jgi:hypothetical protein